jgi:uncharacterized protein YndB with AHSA1/START domain
MSNKMVHRIENEKVLVLERVFNAPRERVFEMWKKCEHLKNWWGPRGWELPVCKIDFRPGGSWLYCMKCVDKNQGSYFGMESWGKVVYHEINEPSKMTYTDFFSDAEGKENKEMPSTKVAQEFIAIGDKTKIVSRGEYASAEALQTVLNMGMIEGITQTWDRLEERLKG